MFTLTRLISGSLLMFILTGTALAQENRAPVDNSKELALAAPLVSATATAKRVRFMSSGTVVQLRLEVYNETGQKLVDTELRGGNVLDWHVQDGAGECLPDGSYAAILTIKSLAGRLSQRVGLVTVNDKTAAIEAAGVTQLSLAQQQTIGPVEGNAAFAVLHQSEAEAMAAVTHDGTEGRLTRTSDALTSRTGSSEGVKFSHGTTLNTSSGKLPVLDAVRELLARPPAAGTGTRNRLAKWAETGGAGTLTDAAATEVSGLTIFGQNASGQVAPLFPGSPTWHILEVGATGIKSPLTLAGGSGVVEFWKDLGGGAGAPAAAVSFGMAKPGTASTNDMVFSTQLSMQQWNERMRLTNAGNLGVGTTTPGSKLDVVGNINTSTQYNIGGTRVFSIAGSNNTFAGSSAGNSNTTGIQNSFFGDRAGATNTTGNNNSFFGANAGRASTTASNNAFFGDAAGQANTIGEDNSFFGRNAGQANTTGADNSFFGQRAGLSNTTGGANSFFGNLAGASNTTGNYNAFFGTNAGSSNTTAGGNSFFGIGAGSSNTTGDGNSFFGFGTGQSNSTGASNSFFGGGAGSANTTGSFNSFFGRFAGSANKTGENNAFFGGLAGFTNTTGSQNSFFGENAGLRNTTGNFNTFFGYAAGQENTTGAQNAFFGQGAGFANTTGQTNSFVGFQAAGNSKTGSGNTVIGNRAGISLIAGSNNIYLANAGADESNHVRIGIQGTQTATFIAGIRGSSVLAGDAVFVDANGKLGGGGASSRRFKQDIRNMGSVSGKLMQLRPVVFHYRPEYVTGKPTLQYGLIAEDVATVYPELVGYGADGKPETVRYHLLNTMMLNEVQKQEMHIQSQARQLQRQARQITDLEARLLRLERQVSTRRRRR